MGEKKRSAPAATKGAKKGEATSEITRKGRPRKIGSQVVDRNVLDSNSFELVEGDNFVAPIFEDKDYAGTGAFKLIEWYDGGEEEVALGKVQVMGASAPKLMSLLEGRLEESDGLVHFCRSDRCKYELIGLNITHLHAFEYITKAKLERLFDDNFIELNHRYWDKVCGGSKGGASGSSRDQRGSDATRGRPVSRGPAASERGEGEKSKQTGRAADTSSLERKMQGLKRKLRDKTKGTHGDSDQAHRGHGRLSLCDEVTVPSASSDKK